jgi:hypothetical protein
MTIQDIIHFIEAGTGKRLLQIFFPVVCILSVVVLRDFRTWTNFDSPEAMDTAQLAHNIAQGKGYTTLFLRPLSIYLVQEKNKTKTIATQPGTAPDYAQVKTAHPDLANPPVYPILLAGMMKILPFHYDVNLKNAFWVNNGVFWRYQPDFLIGAVNLVLFFASVAVAFFIARKLFDFRVARLSAYLMLGCSILWRFTESGLSTMLLILIFLGLTWAILKIEELAREEQPDGTWILCWSALAGILTGVGALTRYSFGWLIIPVLIFLILFSGRGKFINLLAAFVAFAVVLTPWIVRNLSLCGAPFGTAGYAIFAGTSFAGAQLERSLHPDLIGTLWPTPYGHKFLANFRSLYEGDLFKIAGGLISTLFFAGLFLGFNRPATRRMRYFLLMSLGVLILAQTLGHTWLSDQTPEINSENLVVLLAPLITIFGTAFFYILMDRISFPVPYLRYLVVSLFFIVCCLPLVITMWLRVSPVNYPPYYPPDIQKAAAWMTQDEMVMSDVPWAVAWYGQRQSVWLTEDDKDEFFALNDFVKPVSALYLTSLTMDNGLLSDYRSGQNGWGRFVVDAVVQNKIPTDFPLRHSPSGSAAISSGMFLTDSDRWKIGGESGQ